MSAIMKGYYKRLKSLFVASPPAGGAGKREISSRKSKAASAKKTTTKASSRTTAKEITSTKPAAPGKATTRKPSVTAAGSKTKPAGKKTTAKSPAPKKRAARKQGIAVQKVVVKRSLAKGLRNLKERVEAAKFYMPVEPVVEHVEVDELPPEYGENRIICIVRDPYWLHSYWEITGDRLKDAERFFGDEWGTTRTVLRVHDITEMDFDGENSKSYFDIELSGDAVSWYINVNSPNTSFIVDITRVSPSGRTFILARSNPVTTPRDGMSDILDERWMSLDFDKMYALSGGFRIGASSLEMHEMMLQRQAAGISSWLGSAAVSSFGGSPVAEKKRGFWFNLDCELIVYGATEPDATVTMQGYPIALRPDGTFTMRFALPDGVQEIRTTAASADGVEERTITPTVSRKTEASEKILKEC